jgi:hypothetical protein
VTYLARTGRAAEQITAAQHTVDESTAPPTHCFHVRGRIMSTRLITRTDVASVRELPREPAGGEPDGNPLPPFARQVSNRDFPKGRRPGDE